MVVLLRDFPIDDETIESSKFHLKLKQKNEELWFLVKDTKLNKSYKGVYNIKDEDDDVIQNTVGLDSIKSIVTLFENINDDCKNRYLWDKRDASRHDKLFVNNTDDDDILTFQLAIGLICKNFGYHM